MATELIMQGGSIELDESENFNKVRKRLNDAAKLVVDYENGATEDFQPFHLLSFKTADGGRVSVNPEKIIAVTSDQAKDQGGEE